MALFDTMIYNWIKTKQINYAHTEYTVSSEITMDGSAVTEDFAVDNASFDFDFAFYMGQTLTTKRERKCFLIEFTNKKRDKLGR